MSKYVEKSIRKDESIVRKAEVKMIAGMAPTVVIGLLLCVVPIIGWIIAALMILIKFLELLSIELAVTTKRVMGHYGLVPEKIMDAPLNKINTVVIEKGFMASILGYGTVTITTSSGSYNLKYIKEPEYFKTVVMEQMDVFEEDRIKLQAEQLAKAIK